ncbi:cell division protein FtsZ [Psychrobacillus sp. FSL K6-4615]|uniref:cell division protein FtsZ n=1 Tax=Psychrobacillus sp. FSL K6-4615 TaxID=2921551 RepID=UPI0030F902C6
MTKAFITNTPAINMTIVGFGQAGSRMADEFANYKKADGTPSYNCLALNSNDGDLEGLKNIPEENRVSLGLRGMAKNPEKGLITLEENKDAAEKLNNFIHDKVRADDELVLFFAGLGGGTGTSTIVKAISEFYDHHNKPLIRKELIKIKKSVSDEDFKENAKRYAVQATRKAAEKFVKIGVIVTLPLRHDGPDVLRQVNDFSQKIWKSASDPSKGIAFVTFADNQHFYDEFNAIPKNKRKNIDNYRDYANKQISEIFHELNTATTSGGSSLSFDAEDFKRAITEFNGSLVLSKIEVPANLVNNNDDVAELFKRSLKETNLHSPIQLVREHDGEYISKKVYHVGLLAVLDESKKLGNGAFIEKAKEIANKELPVNGVVFDGYVESKNDFRVSVYSFYKTDALPERLETGLVKEYEEFQERNRNFTFEKATIQSIGDKNELLNEDDLDFDDLGISDLLGDDELSLETDDNLDNADDDDAAVDELLNSLDLSK